MTTTPIKNRKYIRQWREMALGLTEQSGYTLESAAPNDVDCKTCWDTGLCRECLGEYPTRCPEKCDGGRCPICRGIP